MRWRNAAASLSLHATQRADKLLAGGDMEGRAVWHRIERAIDELRRTTPGEVIRCIDAAAMGLPMTGCARMVAGVKGVS